MARTKKKSDPAQRGKPSSDTTTLPDQNEALSEKTPESPKAASRTSADAKPAANTAAAPKPDSFRDTIESIVVAFILAFVFRAFVVEAFIIPTGSMAPGLYGQHANHRCALCQYPFAYGIRESKVNAQGRQYKGTLSETFSVKCPNCGWEGKGNKDLNAIKEPVIPSSGDRILVLKWPYDIGGDLLGPKRWDVVVFKDPKDGDTNFIKRLLGLPGEVLQIIEGDIYTAPSSEIPEDIRAALSKPPPPDQPNSHRLTSEQLRKLGRILKIQRKPRIAQDSLWMLHYDHDYMPDSRLANQYEFPGMMPAWMCQGTTKSGGWDASTACVHFDPEDDESHILHLEGKRIEDNYGYNNATPLGMSDSWPVSDVRLRFVLFPRGTSGEVRLTLTKGDDIFTAIIDAKGSATLERRTGLDGLPIVITKSEIEPLKPGTPVSVEFENLDYRVALRLDGEEVLATTDADYAPNVDELMDRLIDHGGYANSASTRPFASQATVSIAAAKLPFDLRHLAIHRDVFYRSDHRLQAQNALTGKRNVLFAAYPGWGTEGNPILLRDEPPDYFCCGDNSPQSLDSRHWWEVCPMLQERTGHDAYQYGTVPGDQMIGRAFFVYWPSGLRLSEDTPAIVPNFGRMRFIR